MTEVARDLAQARVLLDLKRYDEASGLLARIVAAEPQDSQAWCLLAATHKHRAEAPGPDHRSYQLGKPGMQAGAG